MKVPSDHADVLMCDGGARMTPPRKPASSTFGALNLPTSQPAAFDLKGSDAVTLIST